MVGQWSMTKPSPRDEVLKCRSAGKYPQSGQGSVWFLGPKMTHQAHQKRTRFNKTSPCLTSYDLFSLNLMSLFSNVLQTSVFLNFFMSYFSFWSVRSTVKEFCTLSGYIFRRWIQYDARWVCGDSVLQWVGFHWQAASYGIYICTFYSIPFLSGFVLSEILSEMGIGFLWLNRREVDL